MRENVLLTGGTGFIGRNIAPILSEKYLVTAPSRAELDLSDDESVAEYLAKTDCGILVHCAITNPAKEIDAGKDVFTDTMNVFDRLLRRPFRKIVFIGSGAEFDKSHDIKNAAESDIGKIVPVDGYGRAKYAMTERARSSENIFNARIFGCYGPGEPERRFIRHAINCCLRGEPVTIRRDCRFSYVYVNDLGRAIVRLLDGSPRHHDYNVCGETYTLSGLAERVKRFTGVDVPTRILEPGWANTYTGDDTRFRSEFDFEYTPVDIGIAAEIEWMKGLAR